MRALDHLVLATRDLARTARALAALGFQVGSRNRHPWGTENHIVQFHSTFLELVGLAEDYRPIRDGDAAFPFAGFIERYLKEYESGIAMAVLRSEDASADAAAFTREGIGKGRMLPFSRSARGPDGADRTVAFTVAFAEAPDMHAAGFFTCQQHRPENFWNAAFQHHANTAGEITGFTLVSEDLDNAASFLSAFAGQPAHSGTKDGRTIALAGGSIRVDKLRADHQRSRGVKVEPIAGPHISAMQVHILDRSALETALEADAADWIVTADPDGTAVTCRPADVPSFALIFDRLEPR